MTVYDFDKTVFYPDSTYCFVMYCWKKIPGKMMKTIPGVLWQLILRLFGKSDTKALKEKILSFTKEVEDLESLVSQFWDDHWDHFEPWYLEQHREDDLIISASPEFTLREAQKRLGFQLIATKYDPKTGKIQGRNNSGDAKVERFYEIYPDGIVETFYSDSLKDTPMASLAEKAYLVDRGQMKLWPTQSK